MAFIYNVRNDGQPAILLGMKRVNSYNVDPVTYTGTASPNFLTISYNRWMNYDWFNVQQTSASTDGILLPPYVPGVVGTHLIRQGAEFIVYAVSAIKVSTVVDTVTAINGTVITSGVGVAIPAGSYGIFRAASVSGTSFKWTCQLVSTSGAISSPTPA